MAFLNLKVSGQQKFIRNVKGISKRLQNKRGVHLAAVIAYERWIKKNFQADGKNHENSRYKWKPLKESTVQRRRKGRGTGSPKILRDTGSLMGRWNRIATDKFGKIRSGVTHSMTHENGTRHIPQRKIFPADKQGRKIVDPVFRKFVQKAIK
jgi:hypothetical protein